MCELDVGRRLARNAESIGVRVECRVEPVAEGRHVPVGIGNNCGTPQADALWNSFTIEIWSSPGLVIPFPSMSKLEDDQKVRIPMFPIFVRCSSHRISPEVQITSQKIKFS